MSEACPACGSGQLTEHIDHMQTVWGNRYGTVPLRFSICDGCGSEIVNAEQARANKGEVLKFREAS